MVLPGAPRKPSSCARRARRSRRCAAMFWLPNRSTWVAPIITWRRPDHTTSNIERYGFQPRRPSSSAVDADGDVVGDEQRPRRRSSEVGLEASPAPAGRRSSGSCRSGWRGSRRRRGSTRRTATAHTSARVGGRAVAHERTRSLRLVVGLGRGRATSRLNVVPRLGRLRRRRVLLLERLVAVVVGDARGEVRAVRAPRPRRRSISRLMRSVWSEPSFARSSVSTMRSHGHEACLSAPPCTNRSSK